MPFSNFKDELATLNDIVVNLVPAGRGGELGAGKASERTQVKAINNEQGIEEDEQ